LLEALHSRACGGTRSLVRSLAQGPKPDIVGGRCALFECANFFPPVAAGGYVGIRLFLASVRQFFQPWFTAEQIYGIKSDDALPLVRELGVANFATGVVGIFSLAMPGFVMPVAITAGIFYGVAGFHQFAERDRNRNETIAMISDLFVFLVLAVYIVVGLA
jgi:hypothetical protein